MNTSMNDSSGTEPLTGVFLMAHGAPESTDDIPEYLKNIHGGIESTPETIQIIRHRYEQIGGAENLLCGRFPRNFASGWKLFSTSKDRSSKSIAECVTGVPISVTK